MSSTTGEPVDQRQNVSARTSMKRRRFIGIAGGAAAWPLGARAQQKTVPVIGFLNGGSADEFAPYFAAFRHGLTVMGYVDGQNVQIEYRNAEAHYDRLPTLAADLVQRNVSAIATFGLPAVRAAKAATRTIPIAFATGANPITSGLVASFNRPGGNLTGISLSESAMADKQIEMLHEIVPKAELMGVLVNPTNPFYEDILPGLRAAASAINIRLSIEHITSEQEIDTAFASISHLGAGAVFVVVDPLFQDRRDQLVALQDRYSLPTVVGGPEFPRKDPMGHRITGLG